MAKKLRRGLCARHLKAAGIGSMSDRETRAECLSSASARAQQPDPERSAAGAQSKDLSNSSGVGRACELVERSFDSGFASAQDQVLRSGFRRDPLRRGAGIGPMLATFGGVSREK